jgi:hypothetical protein
MGQLCTLLIPIPANRLTGCHEFGVELWVCWWGKMEEAAILDL